MIVSCCVVGREVPGTGDVLRLSAFGIFGLDLRKGRWVCCCALSAFA